MRNTDRVTNTAVDPVCGMTVEPGRAAAVRGYGDKQYYFCCAHCAQKFAANPQQYLAPKPKSAGLVQLGPAPAKSAVPQKPQIQSGTKYFCPMDPEVSSNKPGSCPKCGMALELELTSAAKTEYTCPMHPEVVSDKPGSCPKCGMALEPRIVSASASAEDDSELRSMR